MTKNFARMWLELVAACPEIGALFTPDSRQEWYCEHCQQRGKTHFCLSCMERDLFCLKPKEEEHYKCHAIPRLDQLVGMVQSERYIFVGKQPYSFQLLHILFDGDGASEVWYAGTPEEAVLLGIAYEHRLKWTGKEGEPWEW